MKRARRKRVMIIASGGGHWSQMLRIREAFAGFDVFYVGVKEMYRHDVEPADFYAVRDFSRLQKWNLLLTVAKLAWIVLKERPVAVVTTGSAPGLVAVRLGKLLGARTAWIDSIANVEEVSFSGARAGAVVDLVAHAMGAPESARRAALRRQHPVKVFVTVGTMMPFDRLIRAMDGWAQKHPGEIALAQTGEGGWVPAHMPFQEMLTPDEFRQHCSKCDVIVSHVGMGTVIMAADLHRPLVAMPRRQHLNEANSDHQVATAVWLRKRPGVSIVDTESDLEGAIERMAGTRRTGELRRREPVEIVHRDRTVLAGRGGTIANDRSARVDRCRYAWELPAWARWACRTWPSCARIRRCTWSPPATTRPT